jgi:hypothetical protein
MSLFVQKVAEMDICNAVPRYSVGSFQKPNVEKVLHSFVESHQKNHSNLIFRKSFALSRKYPTNFFKEAGRNDRAYTSPHPKLSTRHHLRVTSHLVTPES